ncbi:MAG: peptidase M75 [Aureispira sp.]|nr:peptidase M75 [Aureispira sp.]
MKQTMKHLTYLLMGALVTLSACTKEKKIKTLKDEVVTNYADLVYASYEDSYDKAVELKTAVNTLVATPTQTNFNAAKTAWKAAREPYGQTEAYRFYDGPIDDADGPEGDLNAWPLDENYIDYVRDGSGGTVNNGIIGDVTNHPIINKTTIAALNEKGGEKNISIGYHAIEFLLWGQDHLDVNVNAGQGGDRLYTDYTSTAANYQRRGEYINACAELLVETLAELKAEWADGGSYRTSFLALDADEAITKILAGIGILSKSELAGERMFVALEANAADNPQEDEHSCFADNTHRDIITNAQGINNVLAGVYVNSAGTTIGDADKSILKLLEEIDEDQAASLSAAMADAMTKVNAIPTPFDKYVTEETVSSNGPILQAINALRTQGDNIAETATALGLTISTDLPE